MTCSTILKFQQRLVKEYNSSLNLPADYRFINGVPVLPVPPLDLAQDGVMILGAYPTALFARIGSERDVPIGNISRPFVDETYFDGSSARQVEAGKELTDRYLRPLQLRRNQCWITNLVRVFLFKQGHLDKYRRLGYQVKFPERTKCFEALGGSDANLVWFYEELQIAKPRVVITLGAEVAGILRDAKSSSARSKLLDGTLREFELGGKVFPCIHLAHPGITMRSSSSHTGTKRNQWHEKNVEHCKAACSVLDELLNRGKR